MKRLKLLLIGSKDRMKGKTKLNLPTKLITKNSFIDKRIEVISNWLKDLTRTLKEQYQKLNLNKTQWYSKKQIDDLQNRYLRHLIHHAYNNCSFYRRIFKRRGLKTDDIKTKEDLSKLPIINKEIVKKYYKEISYPPLRKGNFKTGGSTGQPFKYHWSHYWNLVRIACNWRFWEWANYTKKSRLASFFSRTFANETPNDFIIEGIFNERFIKDVVNKIKEYKPEIIRVYPSSAYLMAKYLLSQSDSIEVRSFITSGETLYDHHREEIEEAFQCKVFDEYGCNDGGIKAFECSEHNGMHYAIARSIVEIVDGKVITTDLWNYALPFIRYENNDVGEILDDECPCGRKLPLLKVEGRINDFLVTPYAIVSSSATSDLYKTEGITQYQIIQKSSELIEVRIVKNENFTKSEFENAIALLIKNTKGMKLKFVFVDAIPPTKMGKRRYIINEWKGMDTIMKEYF